MARPAGIRETKPRKKMAGRGMTDGESYNSPDSGCEDATKYLQRPSLCFLCPFLECGFVETDGENGQNEKTE